MTDRDNSITIEFTDEADKDTKIAQYTADDWYLWEEQYYNNGNFLVFGGPSKFHTWDSIGDVWVYDEQSEVDYLEDQMTKVVKVLVTWITKQLNELRPVAGLPLLTKQQVLTQLKDEWKNA